MPDSHSLPRLCSCPTVGSEGPDPECLEHGQHPPDWAAIVDDAEHEINQRWGEALGDDEYGPADPTLVRETAEAIVRPLAVEREEIIEALRHARAALEKYGRHVGVCPADGGPLSIGRCKCGYHAALAHPVPEGVSGRV